MGNRSRSLPSNLAAWSADEYARFWLRDERHDCGGKAALSNTALEEARDSCADRASDWAGGLERRLSTASTTAFREFFIGDSTQQFGHID